jgi:hypothetical protein
MSKNLKLFKKITCILGITFLVLGMVPLPLVSKITTAAANVVETKGKALGLPNLNLSGEETTTSAVGGKVSISPKGAVSLFDRTSPQPPCTPGGQKLCPTVCGYEGGEVDDGCPGNGKVICEATADCPPVTCSGGFTNPPQCNRCASGYFKREGGCVENHSITFCHYAPGNPHTITTDLESYYGQGHDGHANDYIGTCVTPPTDNCPDDPNKTEPGACGCGVADTDSDGDGTPNCNDGCVNDPAKTAEGACGCGVADTDSDGDGTPNCNDGCVNDPAKIAEGACGCGVADTDSDGDGTPNCNDGCVNDPAKTAPGTCGCGVADADSDNDGTLDCNDGCVDDPAKTAEGACGCGVADTDFDGDGTPDCNDGCVNDPAKTAQGLCGCGVADTDSDSDGIPDCDLPCLGEWGECVGECGVDGVQTFTVTQEAGPGGAACDYEDGETRECQGDPCPVDCIWSDWSACSATCDGGTQTRVIAIQPANGGLECEGPTSQACNTQGCPPPPPPPGGGGIIPVTGGAGGPTEPLIIPVTGIDLSINLAGLQKLFMFMGLMLFGVTMMLEGFDRKRIK